MEGSVLSFLKAECKVSDTGSAHWASSLTMEKNKCQSSYISYINIHLENNIDLKTGIKKKNSAES